MEETAPQKLKRYAMARGYPSARKLAEAAKIPVATVQFWWPPDTGEKEEKVSKRRTLPMERDWAQSIERVLGSELAPEEYADLFGRPKPDGYGPGDVMRVLTQILDRLSALEDAVATIQADRPPSRRPRRAAAGE